MKVFDTTGGLVVAGGGEWIPLSQKGVANGVASLDGNTLVVQNPANATATPTANKIPIADSNGKLNAWVTAGDIFHPGIFEVCDNATFTDWVAQRPSNRFASSGSTGIPSAAAAAKTYVDTTGERAVVVVYPGEYEDVETLIPLCPGVDFEWLGHSTVTVTADGVPVVDDDNNEVETHWTGCPTIRNSENPHDILKWMQLTSATHIIVDGKRFSWKYKALLNTVDSNPVATVLNATDPDYLGAIIWERMDTGRYHGRLTNAPDVFLTERTFCRSTGWGGGISSGLTCGVYVCIKDINRLEIQVGFDGTFMDDMLVNTEVEIEIFP